MISKSIVELLRPISLGHYIRSARETGRGQVEPSGRLEFVSALERVALVYANAANLDHEEERLSHLISDVLHSERALLDNPIPRYPIYTNIAILNRFVGVYSHLSIQDTWARCRKALAILCDDWLSFERHALDRFERSKAGGTETTGENFHEKFVRQRIQNLELLCSFLASVDRPTIASVNNSLPARHPIDWIYYALEHDGAVALAHLSALPQSSYHDEYLFLRTLHLTETCFWAIITGIRAATQAYARNEFGITLLALKESNFFAEFMVRALSVFRTLPYESFFDGFRVATGDSSAVQSEKFQHLEIISRGLSDEKRAALRSKKELSWLADWRPGAEATLGGLLASVEQSQLETASNLRAELFRLDRSLQSWRNIHLGIARSYLPEGTVGTGEEGVTYLEKHFQNPGLFAHADNQKVATTTKLVSENAFVTSNDLLGLRIGFIIARDVPVPALLDAARALGEQTKERLKDLSRDTNYALSKLFGYYDPIFARYSKPFPLKKQLQDAMKNGLPDRPIPKLLLSLELSTGLLMGLHDGGALRFPVRVTTASEGQHFEAMNGKTLALGSEELILADEVRAFASYVQGPDKRTAVQLPTEPTGKTIKSLLFAVFGAPGLPEADFEAALDFVQTAAFSMAGRKPDVYLLTTKLAHV
ncbi:hypothetical protein CP49_33175 [Bradyrhizobium valentinum]|uniref:B3/B4 tRNA-binding domain-containing protein n=2 Tax=Bradyrhizobium valentinum TaxID=1518501 RepID=A0A0R3KVD4_9BRAD|nr:hypothetical protein CP49_33175 [Bradyrhizobium valentinum]